MDGTVIFLLLFIAIMLIWILANLARLNRNLDALAGIIALYFDRNDKRIEKRG